MSDAQVASQEDETPTVTVIQQLKDGSLAPKLLTQDQRQHCVEVLFQEGYSVPQIAQVLKRNEKTIRRDLAKIRVKHALDASPKFSKQHIGNLVVRAELHQARLMRLARMESATVAERAQAEFLAWRVLREQTELLQSLGYLPQQFRPIKSEEKKMKPCDHDHRVIRIHHDMVEQARYEAQRLGLPKDWVDQQIKPGHTTDEKPKPLDEGTC